MANNSLEAAFNVPVTSGEASLLEECFAAAAEISCDFASVAAEELEASKRYYAARNDAFRAAFPERGEQEDPFASFLKLWSNPDFTEFDADLIIKDGENGQGLVAFICGHQVDVRAVASLIQAVCKTALPFGFEWADVCDRFRPGQFGGGYFIITDTEILGGSTGWLMQEMLQTLRAGGDS